MVLKQLVLCCNRGYYQCHAEKTENGRSGYPASYHGAGNRADKAIQEQERPERLSDPASRSLPGGVFDRLCLVTPLQSFFHLLIRTDTKPLGDLMRKVLSGYAIVFNRRHRRSGYLFQNRYKSILCQEDTYLLELVRLINDNYFSRSTTIKIPGSI